MGRFSYIRCSRQLVLGLRKRGILFRCPAWFPLELYDLLLELLVIEPLVLSLLYGLANRRNSISGFRSRLNDTGVDHGNFFGKLSLQLGVDLLESEGPFELELRC